MGALWVCNPGDIWHTGCVLPPLITEENWSVVVRQGTNFLPLRKTRSMWWWTWTAGCYHSPSTSAVTSSILRPSQTTVQTRQNRKALLLAACLDARSPAVTCYHSSGNAETLTQACMYNPPPYLTPSRHWIYRLHALELSAMFGESVLYLCIQHFAIFWVGYVYFGLRVWEGPDHLLISEQLLFLYYHHALSALICWTIVEDGKPPGLSRVRKSALNSELKTFKQWLLDDTSWRLWNFECFFAQTTCWDTLSSWNTGTSWGNSTTERSWRVSSHFRAAVRSWVLFITPPYVLSPPATTTEDLPIR